MKILFLARSLELGGAERQLLVLAAGLKARGHEVGIVLFYPGGALRPLAEQSGVTIHDLAKRGRYDVVGPLFRLRRLVHDLRPDIVHGYLPVPNVLAWLATRCRSGPRLVFGIRASNMDHARYDRLSALSYRLESRLSRDADLVVANSEAGLDAAHGRGFPPGGVVIANGIDTDRFAPDPAQGAITRQGLGVGNDERLVGLVGRLDPMKDHATFLAAAALVSSARPGVRFLCVGSGPDQLAERLKERATVLGIADRLIWLPGTPDLAPVYNALDVLVSSSAYGEGFSNVIAEAMACDLPVVATIVGDAAGIVGAVGHLVPPADPDALAQAIAAALDSPAPAGAARRRIVENFSIDRLVAQSEAAFHRMLAPQVLHVITGLNVGGAERMLQRVVTHAAGPERHQVVSLLPAGRLSEAFAQAGVPVHHLNMSRRLPSPAALWRLAALIRRLRPEFVMTWLYHADLMGTMAARLAGVKGRLIWNLRCSDMNLEHTHGTTRLIRQLLARMSPLPDLIAVNSEAGRSFHQQLGYAPRQWRVVPNGVDPTVFRPDLDARTAMRTAWGVGGDDVVVGMVARWDPMKDHGNFLRAVAAAEARGTRLHPVLVGRGLDRSNPELLGELDRTGLGNRVILLGEREDIPAVMAGLDMLVSASAFGEGFPNVLAEAMACGIACITTDIGDSADIVGPAGWVVPPRAPDAIAGAMIELATDSDRRRRMGEMARRRVETLWSLDAALAGFKALWVS